MSSTVKLYGYLRPHSRIKLHEVAQATDEEIAKAVSWSVNDWRDDPAWICVATCQLPLIQREPTEVAAEAAVKALRQQQTEARAAFEARMVEIERQINSLLAITHEVTA